jgi:Lon protease-like protein
MLPPTSPLARNQPMGAVVGSHTSPKMSASCNFSISCLGPVPTLRSPTNVPNSARLNAMSVGQPQPRRSLIVRAEGSSSGERVRLPIFPLSVVALPSANTPLQIFEARYRVLFSTLLAGVDGIDDGLVSEDKSWKGTRRFGMAYFDQQANGLAAVGTVLEITEHSLMEDGRLMINTIGRERFRIEDVVEERPVLVCDVEILPDDDDKSDEAVLLAEQVAELFRNVVRLSVKLREAPVPPELADPTQLTTLAPSDLSFWVASLFAGNAYNQQAILEEDNTIQRLKTEEELLSSTLKYLSAQAALQSAFGGSGGEDE